MRVRAIAVAVLCLPHLACFEEPILEHLHLRVVADDVVVVAAAVALAGPGVADHNQALAERLANRRQAIDEGWDPWSRRFARLQPAAERTVVERRGGLTTRLEHLAVVGQREEVAELLLDAGLAATFSVHDDLRTLVLSPAASTRATARQREQVERELAAWSAAVAEYLAATGDLYRLLDQRPDLAVPAFALLLDRAREGDEELFTPEQGALAERVSDAMGQVAAALLVDGSTGYSLNELARLAFDPCPHGVSVAVPGEIVELDGFVRRGELLVERPTRDPWRALVALNGRWLEPDLVTALVAPAPDDRQPEPEPEEFAARPRWAAPPPAATEVEAVLLQELVPADRHLVTWRLAAAATATGMEPDPDRELAAAAAALATVAELPLPPG